jgi:hypothetical protein
VKSALISDARPNMSAERRHPAYGFWLVSLVSVIWLGVVVGLLVTRLSEWWPLFQPPVSRERLSLNEIGVVLIGVFSPMTFLWLVMAILFQHKALQQTRQITSAQEQAHEKTVKEIMCIGRSMNQTLDATRAMHETTAQEIMSITNTMNQTLEATRATIIYDEFSLKLYYLAKDVLTEAAHINVTVQPGMTVSLFRTPTHFDLTERQSCIDALFGLFENWLRHGVSAVLDGVSRIDTMDKQRTAAFLKKVRHLNSTITHLLERYASNSLVAARVEGIKLREIQRLLQAVEVKWLEHGDCRSVGTQPSASSSAAPLSCGTR